MPVTILKNYILAPRPLKMSSDKKVMTTKTFPFDEIYLEHGLGFELQAKIGDSRGKKHIFSFFPYLPDSLMS